VIRFKLIDENTEKEYTFELDFKNADEYCNWFKTVEDEFDNFTSKMEEEYGIHDIHGGIDNDGIYYDGFMSYEIESNKFPEVLEKWKVFLTTLIKQDGKEKKTQNKKSNN